MNEVEFVWRAEHRSQVVEAVSFGYCVGELMGVGMSMARVQFDIELVGENFFGVA